MLNIDKFANRIKKILDYYEISAAIFAERIEVQRSSISHILSGRNKPSLEFVLKILKTFPEVDWHWLLEGKGSFPKQAGEKQEVTTTLFSPVTDNKETLSESFEEAVSKKTSSQEIERIVVFFKNGKFKHYDS